MKLRVRTLESLQNDPNVKIDYINGKPCRISYKDESYQEICRQGLFGKVGRCRETGLDDNDEMTYILNLDDRGGTIALFCVEEFI